MSTVITVHVESEPHTENLSGVLLNRPAPNGGSFMIDRRLDRTIWNQMKAAGAWYYSADELEDLDMFDATPGWRYSAAAMEVLLTSGYALKLRGEEVVTVDVFRALWTLEAKAAYHATVEAERQAAEQARQATKRLADEQREVAGFAYGVWQQTFVATGLIGTSIGPDYSAGQYGAGGPWEEIYHAPKGTPGAWYDTGDRWYRNPDGVLRRDYGNASLWYAPQEVIDGWVLACDNGSVGYAGHVLEFHNYGVFGSDVADRLVELKGLDHYIERARSEEWLIKADGALRREVDVFAHYDVPMMPVRIAEVPGYREVREVLGSVEEQQTIKREYSGVGQTPDGRWFATTDRYNGGAWRQLTDAECAALGLSTDPPVDPPQLPEAQSLPSREQTDERSRRFSEVFSG